MPSEHYIKQKQWILKNPEKWKAIVSRWREKNKDSIREKGRVSGLKWYHENKQKVKESYERNKGKRKEKRNATKMLVFKHYSEDNPFCACCGEREIEFLSIDHINGGGYKQRKELKTNGGQFYVWLIKNGYPEGFQILCMNCNFAKGHFGGCPHNKVKKDAACLG